MKFKEQGEIIYPEYIDEVAQHLGNLRHLSNLEINTKIKEFNRGDQAEAIDILGIKCELIVQNFLFNQGIPFTAAKILDDKPIVEPDIIIGDKIKIDVKGINSNSTALMVNERAHSKAKDITHYWFVQQQKNGVAKYWIYKHQEIDEWSLKEAKFTDAYCLPFDHMIKFDFSSFVKS